MNRKKDWDKIIHTFLFMEMTFYERILSYSIGIGTFFILLYIEIFYPEFRLSRFFGVLAIFYLPFIIWILIIILFFFRRYKKSLSECTEIPTIIDNIDKDILKNRGKIIVRLLISFIGFFIGFVIVYYYFEIHLRIEKYGYTDVLIATGIPLTFFIIGIMLAIYSSDKHELYKHNKERFEILDFEKQERIRELKKPLIVLGSSILFLSLLLLVIIIRFTQIPWIIFVIFAIIIIILSAPLSYYANKFYSEVTVFFKK